MDRSSLGRPNAIRLHDLVRLAALGAKFAALAGSP